MKILSIDVGIKNLAFCLLEKPDICTNFKILKWNSINVAESETYKCCEIEKGKVCDKPAKFIKSSSCYCLKHSKKQNIQIPTSELSSKFINKQKFQSLFELADKYNIKYEKPIKKLELVNIIKKYIQNSCFQSITKVNASKTDLVTIGRNIKIKFDEIFSECTDIDIVIIENQISPIANRMKTIQGMISQYFIMKKTDQQIEFISSSNKLKGINTENTKKIEYGDRKKLGIQQCLELLVNNGDYIEWVDYFKTHSKKDDLADSLLQGLWYIGKIGC